MNDRQNTTKKHSGSHAAAKREKLFDIFSANLETIKQHPAVKFDPDFTDVRFMCPICMRLFSREALDQSFEVPLTLEDVPPKSVGGKPITLTCKECNNPAGAKLDEHIFKKLRSDEFFEGVTGSRINARFLPGNGIEMDTVVELGKNRELHIVYDPKKVDPAHLQKLSEMIQSTGIQGFNLHLSGGYRIGFPQTSLLRAAYLWAFAFFGYGFLLNPKLAIIRKQIADPIQQLIRSYGLSKQDYSDSSVGMNMIYDPPELRSFFVVLGVKGLQRRARYGLMLPGPNGPGLDVYQTAAKLREAKNVPQLKLVHIPEGPYLSDPQMAFYSHELWNHYRRSAAP